ncbi:hypothetical protein [Paractinoplanes atraurantiacus]|uniref:hypothetical protein n=1 Tax=Paractinoplanes atraurantiacus TaxID=1036182 RepID=UPI001178B328|nr:hypothetical protein [Actinoplanes atraurantiacus]
MADDRRLGNCDAELADGPGLTEWLAGRGLTGSHEAQQSLARQDAEEEARRVQWVAAAPPPLTEAAERASRREDDAEEALAGLVARQYPDPVQRIRTLVGWAGVPPRHSTSMGGTPWYELAPRRLLLTEPKETIFEALTSAPLSASQLDGAAELFTCLEWKGAGIPESLRAALVEYVTATGTDPMTFRMDQGYGTAAP